MHVCNLPLPSISSSCSVLHRNSILISDGDICGLQLLQGAVDAPTPSRERRYRRKCLLASGKDGSLVWSPAASARVVLSSGASMRRRCRPTPATEQHMKKDGGGCGGPETPGQTDRYARKAKTLGVRALMRESVSVGG